MGYPCESQIERTWELDKTDSEEYQQAHSENGKMCFGDHKLKCYKESWSRWLQGHKRSKMWSFFKGAFYGRCAVGSWNGLKVGEL